MVQDDLAPGVYIVGQGVKGVSQLTLEANKVLTNMDLIVYMDSGSEVHEYISIIGKKGFNVLPWYQEHWDRMMIYEKIANYIIRQAKRLQRVAYLASGNPLFLNSICELILNFSKIAGIRVEVFSGVSSIDTIITDLRIPVGDFGLQCYDATVFGQIKPKIDTSVPLMLFDPGVFCDNTVRFRSAPQPSSIVALRDCLLSYYSNEQIWILVHSAMSSKEICTHCWGPLSDLDNHSDVVGRGTLLIPGSWGSRFLSELVASSSALA